MNFLAPLYALAALAIAAPIVLHLVRRQPKERFEFSALMFLDPAPPRLTSKSRIDHWLVLLARIAVLALLALAFARPYWNSSVDIPGEAGPRLHRIVLIDQSASMRRPGVWDAAKARAQEWIRNARPTDTLAIYGFADSSIAHLPLSVATETPIAQRAKVATAALSNVQPTWGSSQLGSALANCLDVLQADEGTDASALPTRSEIVLISDMTEGVEFGSLADREWPTHVTLRVERVEPKQAGNAYFNFLEPGPNEDTKSVRVRISNARNSQSDSFRLQWLDSTGQLIDSAEAAHQVPSGSARVVRLESPPENAVALQLTGDACDFDNRRFHWSEPLRTATVLCIEEPDTLPEASLSFFLERLPLDTDTRRVVKERIDPDAPWLASDGSTPVWVIATHHLSARYGDRAREYVKSGGHLMLVMDAPADALDPEGTPFQQRYSELTSQCTEAEFGSVSEAELRGHALWTRIDFGHPVFSVQSDPQFNDYSKVRFWRHRRIELADPDAWRILAWFDTPSPALIERRVGDGKLVVMAAGWQPIDSQLGLSSKFVPMMVGLFALASPESLSSPEWIVGRSVQLPASTRLIGPNGPMAARGDKINPTLEATASMESQTESQAGPNAEPLREFLIDTPGLYEMLSSDGSQTRIAANASASESKVEAMDLEEFSRFGITLPGPEETPIQRVETQRQMIATELESRQSGWWWLISAALVGVGLESVLCMRKRSIEGDAV